MKKLLLFVSVLNSLFLFGQNFVGGVGLGFVKPFGVNPVYLGLNAFGQINQTDTWGYGLNLTMTLPNRLDADGVSVIPIDPLSLDDYLLVNSTNKIRFTMIDGTRRYFIGDPEQNGVSGHFGTGIGMAICSWKNVLSTYDKSKYTTDASSYVERNKVIYINGVFEGGAKYRAWWGGVYANFSFGLPFTGFLSNQKGAVPAQASFRFVSTASVGLVKYF
jgi:hypothetical protein